MLDAWAIVAVACLTSSPAHHNVILAGYVRDVAIRMEIIDERECRYTLIKADEFGSDLAILRRRQIELKDAPHLYWADTLPSREVCNNFLDFNRRYLTHLKSRQALDLKNRDYYETVIGETDLLYRIWDTVRDAKCDYYYVTVRRAALGKLKEEIGDKAFYTSELPPYVPLWRFQESR